MCVCVCECAFLFFNITVCCGYIVQVNAYGYNSFLCVWELTLLSIGVPRGDIHSFESPNEQHPSGYILAPVLESALYRALLSDMNLLVDGS